MNLTISIIEMTILVAAISFASVLLLKKMEERRIKKFFRQKLHGRYFLDEENSSDFWEILFQTLLSMNEKDRRKVLKVVSKIPGTTKTQAKMWSHRKKMEEFHTLKCYERWYKEEATSENRERVKKQEEKLASFRCLEKSVPSYFSE